MKALVVDDSKAIRMMIGRMLRDLGFEVREASNGQEALDVLAKGPSDIALVDWNMPVMNGLELVTAIRANPAFAAMRVMMVTTETELTQVERALQAGASEYLMKPFSKEAISEKLAILGFGGGSAE